MPVNLSLAPAVPVAGVDIATVAAGIKRDGTPDLVLFGMAEGSRTAAVFTRNAFAAAPVTVAREHLRASGGEVRALLINAGNANAGTGEPGIVMARAHCEAVADALRVSPEAVLPFSTGVIGQLLPDAAVRGGIAAAASALGEASSSDERWRAAAHGIMTTDTAPKLTSRTVTLGDERATPVTITGMAKGAGMIEPHMATMLAYVFTDANVGQADLERALAAAVDVSFNAITVDGDTSTNDACVLCATGQGAALSSSDTSSWTAFVAALSELFRDLAQAIVRDAEGATKFIGVRVTGGRDAAECRAVGYAVANSPLVKTAMFAGDANVGRLLMAIGKADVHELDAARVRVSLGDVLAFEAGGIAPGYTEERGAAIMARDEIVVTIELGRAGRGPTERGPGGDGDGAAVEIWTSDLSHAYVSINADYRS